MINNDSMYVTTLLIILVLFSFIRSIIYILFDDNLINIDKKWEQNFSITIDYVLVFFAFIRIFLITLILMARNFKNDILTYILYYLAFAAVLKIYLIYEDIISNSKTELYKYIDKYLDYQAIVILLGDVYILKYIFF